jgi:hypothetical protein
MRHNSNTQLKVVKKTRNDVAEAELQRRHNYSTKDCAALEAVFNEGVTKTALQSIRSTEVGGKSLGYYMIRNDSSTSVVGALAIVKLL